MDGGTEGLRDGWMEGGRMGGRLCTFGASITGFVHLCVDFVTATQIQERGKGLIQTRNRFRIRNSVSFRGKPDFTNFAECGGLSGISPLPP